MSLNDGSKKVENGDSLIFLAVNSSCRLHLSVIIQIVLAAAGATSTMAHRVRVRLGLGLGFVDIRVSVVYAKVYNFS